MVILCVISFHMGGQIANPIFPFGRGIRETHTEFTGGVFSDSLAAITLLDNSVAPASIEFASSFSHKEAIVTLS
jgi:hypothetical protein